MEVLNEHSWCLCGKEESMAIRGYNTREVDTTQYTPAHIKSILKSIGLDVTGETSNDFLCYCPFHSNRHTSSFSVSREKGAFICFNPACGEAGTLQELVKRVMNKTEFEAMRFISSKEAEALENFDELLAETMADKPVFEEFSKDTLGKLHSGLMSSDKAKEYFKSRGILSEALSYFELGYSENMGMVTVPVHSPDGMPIGFVGRSIEGKEFKNTPGLPKSKTLFNLHRVKSSGKVYIVESSFDAIRLDQCGFPAVATLGSNVSNIQIELLQKYFNDIIVIADNDEAGGNMKTKIVEKLGSRVSVIKLNKEYKDIGDMDDKSIQELSFQFDKSIQSMLN
jgi:DNA primase